MEKYNPKIQKELVQIYLEKFWPKWRRELYSELYRTFHPSTYEDSFYSPTDSFMDMLNILEENMVGEGVKLGLINPDTFNSFPRLDGKLILDEGAKLDWIHGMLLYSVLHDIVMEFRCYRGENGIDPNCEGKYMNDFYCLKQIYERLYDYMLQLEELGVPIGDLIGQEKLKKIPLVDLPVEEDCTGHKHSWRRVDRETEECRGRGGCGLRRSDYLEPGQLWRGTDGINDEENQVSDVLYGVDNNQGFDEDDVIQDYEDPNELLQEALKDDTEAQYLLDNIDLVKVMKGPDSILIADYVEGLREWGRYNMLMTDLSPFLTDPETVLKGELSSEIMQWATENESWPPNYEEFFNQQEDPLPYLWAMRQKIRDAMTRLTMRSMEQAGESMEMDNVNKIFKALARRLYTFVLQGPPLKRAQQRKRRLNEADDVNPTVVVGDVIQLLYMDDPWSPIPVATKGIVVGFEPTPWETKILVKWIIDPDKPEFRNMPLLPDIDFYRIVKTDELLEESVPLNEQETQEIKYGKVNEPWNNRLVYFNNIKDRPLPGTEKIILVGPTPNHPTISIDADEVKSTQSYGKTNLQVNYNSNTRGEIDMLLNRLNLSQPQSEVQSGEGKCDLSKIMDKKYWQNTKWRKKLQLTIREILNEVYAQYKSPLGKPTKYHIPNGFVNVPGTEAYGTTHGWSILNFFETNSRVRRILIKSYEKHKNDNNLNCYFNIDEFMGWLKQNKNELFGMGKPTFNELVKNNKEQWKGGQKTEDDAAKYLKNLYGVEWEAYYSGEPGIFDDAIKGADITMIKTGTNQKHPYQVKPFLGIDQQDGQWWVESYDLKHYGKDKVKYYFFGPTTEGQGYIFTNGGEKPTVVDNKEYYVFNSPPLHPKVLNESLYSSFWA